MILNFDLMDLTRWLTENAPRLLISAIIVDSVCRGVLLHPPYHVGAKRSDRMERLFRLRRKATEKQVLQTLLILTTRFERTGESKANKLLAKENMYRREQRLTLMSLVCPSRPEWKKDLRQKSN